MQPNEHQLVVIADYDFGDVSIERRIVESAGFTLVAAECKSEDDVIDVATNANVGNDAALYRALTEGWIAGAGLDDIAEEPAKWRDWKPTNPLFGLDNVVITPHAAYYSEEAMGTVREFAAQEVVRVLSGKPPLSPVNGSRLAQASPT
jgi:hypothetical protein